MPRAKRYAGTHPDDNGGLMHLADLSDRDGEEWAVYAGEPNAKGWADVKLAVHGKAKHKGNYWLVWNGERFAKGTEHFKLVDRRPELADALTDLLQGLDLNIEAEPDPDGYDLI